MHGGLAPGIDRELLPAYLQLEGQDPPAGDLPELLPPPETSLGPHLGYSVQWFLFAAIAMIIYALALRQRWQPEEANG